MVLAVVILESKAGERCNFGRRLSWRCSGYELGSFVQTMDWKTGFFLLFFTLSQQVVQTRSIEQH